MLKKNVLKKNWEFNKVIDLKKQIINRYLIIYYKKNNSQLRIGISVSKKFAIAVKRNYYRRQTRILLNSANCWDLKYDVVLILRKDFLSLPYDQKQKKIINIFDKLKEVK